MSHSSPVRRDRARSRTPLHGRAATLPEAVSSSARPGTRLAIKTIDVPAEIFYDRYEEGDEYLMGGSVGKR